jgi:hypothetical protein
MENTSSALPMLHPRKVLSIGFDIMCSKELFELVYDRKLEPSEVRETLREVVQEVGVGHTDARLVEMTIHRILHNISGRV